MAVSAAEIAAAPKLDDVAVIAYCDLVHRGVKLWLNVEGKLMAGPPEYLTDEVRGLIAANRDELWRAVNHARDWSAKPWNEPNALALLQATVRGMASMGDITGDARAPTAADIRAAADGLPTQDERDLALAFARRHDAHERIDAAHAVGDHEGAKAILHADYWSAGHEAMHILTERFGNRMPPRCAAAVGTNPAWVKCENELEDALAARSMVGVWVACMAMRYVAASVRARQIERIASEDEW